MRISYKAPKRQGRDRYWGCVLQPAKKLATLVKRLRQPGNRLTTNPPETQRSLNPCTSQLLHLPIEYVRQSNVAVMNTLYIIN